MYAKGTFLKSTPITFDPRYQNDGLQDQRKVNIGLTVNHAPLGSMLRHRTRHDLLMRAGEKNLAGSLYPLDKNIRYTALNTGLDVPGELPPIEQKKVGGGGWQTSKQQEEEERRRG